MSHLIVLGFDNVADAFRIRSVLAAMQQGEHVLELEDAVVVSRTSKGKVRLHQPVNLTVVGALGGAICGGFIGLIMFNPLMGAVIGAASGAVSGLFSDIGVTDQLMKDVGETLQPGTAALFVRIKMSTSHKVHLGLRQYAGIGRVLQTSMPKELEDELRHAVEGTAPIAEVPEGGERAPTSV